MLYCRSLRLSLYLNGGGFMKFAGGRILFAMVVYFLVCNHAFAGAISQTFCSTAAVMLDVARGIATIGVIVLGIGALLGKITWGQGVLVIAGIGVMFGGAAIVTQLTDFTSTAELTANALAAAAAAPAYAGLAITALTGCGAYSAW